MPCVVCLLAVSLLSGCQAGAERCAGDQVGDVVPVLRLHGVDPADKLSEGLREIVDSGATEPLRVMADLAVQVDLNTLGAQVRDLPRRQRRLRVIAALRQVAAEQQTLLEARLEALRRRGLVLSCEGLCVVNRLLIETVPEGVAELARFPEVASLVEEMQRPSELLSAQPGGGQREPGYGQPAAGAGRRAAGSGWRAAGGVASAAPRSAAFVASAAVRPPRPGHRDPSPAACRPSPVLRLQSPVALIGRMTGLNNSTHRGAPTRVSWALQAIGANQAWAAGLDGRGVVVGIIDSGASARHEQLRDGFSGAPRGWYDPGVGSTEPTDVALGHGTGVLSCAVGRNINGSILGVAPRAGWVACAAFPEGNVNNILLAMCADWMLTTAKPDVLINAWLVRGPSCDRSLARMVDAWRAAEILPIFAAGNLGPEPGSDLPPANLGRLYPGDGRALSVGGIGRLDAVMERSSAGPNSCDGSVFPLVAAPAEGLIAALPLSEMTYREAEGTSFAAGLVAGAAALLLHHSPETTVGELELALLNGAADVGPPGPDNRFGHGRIDIPGALEALAKLKSSRQ